METIESEKHCDLFNREMEKRESVLDVLVQVNTSEEDQKGGIVRSSSCYFVSLFGAISLFLFKLGEANLSTTLQV